MSNAEEELLADFVGENLLGTKEKLDETLHMLSELKQKKRGLFEKIRDFFRDLIHKFKGNKSYKSLLNDLEYLNDRLERLAQSEDNKKITATEGDVKYSTEKSFDEQIDDVISGTHNPRYDLYVDETPEYLVNLNFSEKPMLMRNGKVSEIIEKHSDMSIEILKQIPNAIKEPLLVLKSKTHPKNSVVIITDISTANGDLIVPIWANQSGNYIDLDLGDVTLETNFVASAYGRNTSGLINYAVKNDGVLYQNPDTKKVEQLLARNGLQLPTPLKLSASDITIPQSDTVVKNNISENTENYVMIQ